MIAALAFSAAALLIGAWLLLRRPTYASAALFAGLLISLVAAQLQTLGRAKPLWMAYELRGTTVRLLAYWLDEPSAIYVLVAVDGDARPELVRLPWSEGEAVQMQDVAQQAKEGGGHMTLRFEDNGGHSVVKLALPAPLPPKNGSGGQ